MSMFLDSKELNVAPFAGAWIEIFVSIATAASGAVAPFAGAWIEILAKSYYTNSLQSLPSRERGLKCVLYDGADGMGSRSLRGSVD